MIKIIPVIDLKDGKVVHARQGLRNQYQPIDTELCRSSDIYQVIQAFMGIYDFNTFYIADINALCHQGNHDRLITEVTARFPGKEFWIDRGCRQPDKTNALPENHWPVLGSESISSKTIQAIKSSRQRFILSLDYSTTGALGDKSLFFEQEFWPETIIIMTLSRVGSNYGPDISLLTEFKQKFPDKNFIAAGGIRNTADLQALKQVGIQQALIASALHSGAIRHEDIKNL